MRFNRRQVLAGLAAATIAWVVARFVGIRELLGLGGLSQGLTPAERSDLVEALDALLARGYLPPALECDQGLGVHRGEVSALLDALRALAPTQRAD